jgi:hypothetical protein
MTMGEVDVYLRFAEAVAADADERHEFLNQLESSLSPSMEMIERDGQACVHFDYADPTAAIGAVQQRAKPIMAKLGLGDQQVTWSLEAAEV